MPPRFRRHVWIKRGDFLLVDPIEEGDKVKAEMSLVLLPPHVRFLQRQGLWPEAFAPREGRAPPEDKDGDSDGGLFVNTNRVGVPGDTGDSEEETGDSEDTGDSEEETGDTATGDAEKDTGDAEEDTGDTATGDTAARGDKATHPRDSGDKDRGAGGTQEAPCPPP
ncbi:probable RNA-binding protein EIF1AD [Numenius arquata]|uniref:probable RNA-binding protein EIF1AD n=1 Tax=Numenius arquata TaxID=31919 RepID=UPI003D30B729